MNERIKSAAAFEEAKQIIPGGVASESIEERGNYPTLRA